MAEDSQQQVKNQNSVISDSDESLELEYENEDNDEQKSELKFSKNESTTQDTNTKQHEGGKTADSSQNQNSAISDSDSDESLEREYEKEDNDEKEAESSFSENESTTQDTNTNNNGNNNKISDDVENFFKEVYQPKKPSEDRHGEFYREKINLLELLQRFLRMVFSFITGKRIEEQNSLSEKLKPKPYPQGFRFSSSLKIKEDDPNKKDESENKKNNKEDKKEANNKEENKQNNDNKKDLDFSLTSRNLAELGANKDGATTVKRNGTEITLKISDCMGGIRPDGTPFTIDPKQFPMRFEEGTTLIFNAVTYNDKVYYFNDYCEFQKNQQGQNSPPDPATATKNAAQSAQQETVVAESSSQNASSATQESAEEKQQEETPKPTTEADQNAAQHETVESQNASSATQMATEEKQQEENTITTTETDQNAAQQETVESQNVSSATQVSTDEKQQGENFSTSEISFEKENQTVQYSVDTRDSQQQGENYKVETSQNQNSANFDSDESLEMEYEAENTEEINSAAHFRNSKPMVQLSKKETSDSTTPIVAQDAIVSNGGEIFKHNDELQMSENKIFNMNLANKNMCSKKSKACHFDM